MRPLLGLPFKCSGCGSRDVSLWLFARRAARRVAWLQANRMARRLMETYADQVVSHNVEYDNSCLGPTKP